MRKKLSCAKTGLMFLIYGFCAFGMDSEQYPSQFYGIFRSMGSGLTALELSDIQIKNKGRQFVAKLTFAASEFLFHGHFEVETSDTISNLVLRIPLATDSTRTIKLTCHFEQRADGERLVLSNGDKIVAKMQRMEHLSFDGTFQLLKAEQAGHNIHCPTSSGMTEDALLFLETANPDNLKASPILQISITDQMVEKWRKKSEQLRERLTKSSFCQGKTNEGNGLTMAQIN
jgi:hypothetical protein